MKVQIKGCLLIAAVGILIVASAVPAGSWQEFPLYISQQEQQKPDIFGNTVVWQELIESDWDIYAADIANEKDIKVFALAAFVEDQNEPISSFLYTP